MLFITHTEATGIELCMRNEIVERLLQAGADVKRAQESYEIEVLQYADRYTVPGHQPEESVESVVVRMLRRIQRALRVYRMRAATPA